MIVDPKDYQVEIDPLHRNVWPVTFRGEEVGRLTEHITVNVDGVAPPIVRWSWALDVARDSLEGTATIGTKARFTRRDDALGALAQVHHAIYRTGTR
jgi:hypothetical protein